MPGSRLTGAAWEDGRGVVATDARHARAVAGALAALALPGQAAAVVVRRAASLQGAVHSSRPGLGRPPRLERAAPPREGAKTKKSRPKNV